MIPMVSIAYIDERVWIRVVGRGSFQCSPCLKKIVQEQLKQGRYDYVIDLEACEQLDSTFMGTLTGISQRLKMQQKGSVRVINVSEGNKLLMENLGLDQLFPISSITEGKELPPAAAEYTFFQITEAANIAKESVRDTVRSAHEALVTANHANAPKFQSLLEMM